MVESITDEWFVSMVEMFDQSEEHRLVSDID